MIQEELVCIVDHLQAIQTIVDLHQATQIIVDHHQAKVVNLAEDHHQATLRIEVQADNQDSQAHNARAVLKVLQAPATCSVINEPEIVDSV